MLDLCYKVSTLLLGLADHGFEHNCYFSETFLLSCVLQVRLCFAEYKIRLNILFHFLVLYTNWKSLPYKFSKHVDNQEVQIRERDEGHCYFLDFLSQLRHIHCLLPSSQSDVKTIAACLIHCKLLSIYILQGLIWCM